MIDIGAVGTFEPSLTARFLPKCSKCDSPHPLAVRHVQDKQYCHVCGARAGSPGEPFEVPAVLTTGTSVVGRALMSIGRCLISLRRKL